MACQTEEAVTLAQIDIKGSAERIIHQVATNVLDPIIRPIVKERAAVEAAPFAPAATAAIVVPILLIGGLIAALAVRARGNGQLGHELEGAGKHSLQLLQDSEDNTYFISFYTTDDTGFLWRDTIADRLILTDRAYRSLDRAMTRINREL